MYRTIGSKFRKVLWELADSAELFSGIYNFRIFKVHSGSILVAFFSGARAEMGESRIGSV